MILRICPYQILKNKQCSHFLETILSILNWLISALNRLAHLNNISLRTLMFHMAFFKSSKLLYLFRWKLISTDVENETTATRIFFRSKVLTTSITNCFTENHDSSPTLPEESRTKNTSAVPQPLALNINDSVGFQFERAYKL